MSKLYKVENLKLAALKYFHSNASGVELTDPLGYAIFYKNDDGTYVNVLDSFKEYPLFERIPYANVDSYGEDYGGKMYLVNNIFPADGPCYVLFKTSLEDSFDEPLVGLEEIEEYVLKSRFYFVDRKNLAKERLMEHPFKMLKILKNDQEKENKVVEFFEDRGVQYKKR